MSGTARKPGNLPAESTTFVGRRTELEELRRTLSRARLVSLVGPGGVGKTRLAKRIAHDLARGFRHGAWMIELAELDNPALVPNAAMAALGLRDQASAEPAELLRSYLTDKDLLLVVDNCEHLVAACASLIGQILDRAPGVKVIATSREPLSIAGEYVLPVPPMRLPDLDQPLAQLRQNESVSLFAERAAAASGRFELSEDNRAAVVELCRRLDGLPLALELAAVRQRALSVDQILNRLSDRFELLTKGSRAALPRHQTLRTTIDWSYDLLSPTERAVFLRLSVFAGTFDLDAVRAVCEVDEMSEGQHLDTVTSLVDKSLVIKVERGPSARYDLHETIREYALSKLRDAGEEQEARDRLARYYVATCRWSVEDVRSRLVEWLDWMEDEIENIRSILKRSQDIGDYATGIALAASVGWYWATRATTEGVRWLDEFLSHPGGDDADLALAYYVRGFLAMMQVNPVEAEPALDRAVAAARSAGDVLLLVQALTSASLAKNMSGDHGTAVSLAEQAAAMAEELGDPVAVVAATQATGFNALVEGDLAGVQALYSRSARLTREIGDAYMLQYSLINLAFTELISGRAEASRPLLEEGLRIARRIDDRAAQFYLLDGFACCAAISGQARLAARLLGAAAKVRQDMGGSVNALLAPLLAQAEGVCRDSLGTAKFDAEFAVGAGMGREEAAAVALGESKPSAPMPAGADGILARREHEVAALVAEGLSNKQIGARLFISERTVESHVRSILNKLGFNSRAQIAGWAASR